MDFAPYQSSPPETQRAFSPPLSNAASPRASLEYASGRRSFSPLQQPSPPPLQHPQPQRQWGHSHLPLPTSFPSLGGGGSSNDPPANLEAGNYGGNSSSSGNYYGLGNTPGTGYRSGVSEFETSLSIRLDYEACLAYLAFPPIGAILLLILERKSDYVRFHAWQSSLLFTAIFVVHLIFSWSSFLSWFFFVGDVVLIVWLTLKAWQDADTLDRYEVPVFGRVASRFLDDE
ncbi:hypothetical protein MKZ38_001138 [Zalerion maritima]|uniref:Uncharacterized protein n=1 Tax=Zalerion maritima TaxID=339359 RepID=A0AAD5RQN9_9PEZI|nr:hypothetical protein MKZ38_001138 [Zalerion maritima]